MGADNFVNSVVGGKRAARRSRVLLAARLETPLGSHEARLRDLSRMGALVECPAVLTAGEEVVFVRGDIRIPARVAWASSGRVGIEFHHMIDESEVLVQLRRKKGAPQDDIYTRPSTLRSMSARDLRLAKAWGVNVGLNIPDDR